MPKGRLSDLLSRQKLLLLLSLAIGFALRAWDLPGQSLSADEVWELQHIKRGLAAADGFPPLYNLLLIGWLTLFPGAVSARWLSVLFGLLCVCFGWLLGRRLGGDSVGVWTALFLAVSPLHVWYSQDGRMYTLYVLLAAITLWALVRAMEGDSPRDWILFTAAAAAGMYVHYYFAIVVLVAAIIILTQRGHRRLAKPIAAYAAIAALCLPLLWLISKDFGLQAETTYAYRGGLGGLGYTYVSFLTGYTLGPSLRELHTMTMGQAFVGFLPWLALLALPLAVLSYHAVKVLNSKTLVWLGLLIVAPVAIAGILGMVTGVGYHVRYVVWVIVPVAVLLGAGASRWRRWPVAIAVIILFGVFVVAVVNRRYSERYRDEDMRAVSIYLRSQPDITPIFVLPHYMARPVWYYLGNERAVYALQGSALDSAGVLQDLDFIDSLTPAGQSYWLVYSREFHGDPLGSVRDTLEQRDGLNAMARFAGVVLYRGTRRGKVSHDSPEVTRRPKRSTS